MTIAVADEWVVTLDKVTARTAPHMPLPDLKRVVVAFDLETRTSIQLVENLPVFGNDGRIAVLTHEREVESSMGGLAAMLGTMTTVSKVVVGSYSLLTTILAGAWIAQTLGIIYLTDIRFLAISTISLAVWTVAMVSAANMNLAE